MVKYNNVLIQMTTITFLKALRDKLKIGNTRSIHLNALPGVSATKLDIFEINNCKKNLADDFIDTLTSQANFEFDILFKNSTDKELQTKLNTLSKRINTIMLQNEDEYKEHGVKTFGFGYPILVKRLKKDPTRVIKAPLFIWYLDIERNNAINSWKIVRNKSKNQKGNYVNDDIHAVSLNEVLLSFLVNDEQVSMSQIKEELVDDLIITKAELLSECKRVMQELTGELNNDETYNLTTRINGYIEPLPGKAAIDEKAFTEPFIINGGVFGLYQSQKESIIKDIDKSIEKFSDFKFENLQFAKIDPNPHGSIETDPSQQQILNTLGIEPKKIIQGPPGTGKSQTLTALIINAMANDLKCLVVCEKKTALDVIRNNIFKENEQLGNLIAVVDDITKDRDSIVSSVRDRINNLGQNTQPNEYQYTTIRAELEKTATDINAQHKLLDKAIYEGQKWPELVGGFLKKRKLAEPDFLNKFIDYKNFQFQKDQSELSRLSKNIQQAESLIAKTQIEHTPFATLMDSVFMNESTARGLQLELNTALSKYIHELETLAAGIEMEIKNYHSFLATHFSAYHLSVKDAIQSFLDYVESNQSLYGDAFVRNDTFTLLKVNLLSLLSKKYKQLKANKLAIPGKQESVKAAYEVHHYFQHVFCQLEKHDSYALFQENIRKLDALNESWYASIPGEIESLVLNFSSKTSHESYAASIERISGIENDLSKVMTEFNNKKIVSQNITPQETLNNSLKEIYPHLSIVKSIRDSKEDFISYFDWRKFYNQLNQIDQYTINGLIASKCINWVAHFESWYYYWLLDQTEDKFLPKSDAYIDQYVSKKPQLKIPQIKNILWQWETQQHLQMKKAKEEKRNPISLYNKRGSKGEKRNSLRKIVDTDFGLFTSFFPVVMTNPSVCSSILPLQEGLFDLVIFDEASQLRLEDTFTSIMRGKIKVVSGDSQQMPPSSYFMGAAAGLSINSQEDDEQEDNAEQEIISQRNEEALSLADSESLLDYAEKNGFKSSMLKVHYRSQHPDLIQFSNHAFYGNQLIPVPARVNYMPIVYHEVGGLYAEQQNMEEAKRVIDILLNHIHPLKDGKYPSVGIATLNLKQRNLISMELLNLQQTSTNADQVKKINDLYEAGFFVKNLENIQGDERDIIILSTTFGKRADGSFRQNFGPLGQAHGYKLLNVIITRAKLQLHICSSIPFTSISEHKEMIEQEGTKGKGIFYGFLAYAKAISDNDRIASDSILQHIWKFSSSKDFTIAQDALVSDSVFEDEVYNALAEKIDSERIMRQYGSGSFRIDLMIRSKTNGNPLMAIECDGSKYHSSSEAYAWDMFRQKQLEKQGFKFHRIWSANWWNDHQKELDNLVKFIEQADREESALLARPVVVSIGIA